MIPTKEEMVAALNERQGAALQDKVSSAIVAVCGLGGLGSNIAVSLARAGVGKLILIDFDKVDITNLHRQQYKASQIGRYKTDALSENLKEIAPYIEQETHTVRIDKRNALEILKEADIICEAFDNAECKAMLAHIVLEAITDNSSGEEYVLHRVTGAAGTFVGRVKSEYEAVLEGIAAKCFDPDVFKSEQAKAVIAYMGDTYGDEPEFLWQKFPDNAVVRRKDNRKWYAAILTVSRRKLGSDSDALVEILDLRIKPEELEHTIDNIKYFPGYHMNKKHWYTICLDGSVSIEEIDRRIDESYFLAKK